MLAAHTGKGFKGMEDVVQSGRLFIQIRMLLLLLLVLLLLLHTGCTLPILVLPPLALQCMYAAPQLAEGR